MNTPICQKCGKPHSGQCMLGTNSCFNYKKPGHFAKDCPQEKEPVKGRIFAMKHDQIDPDSAIVIGMIHIVDLTGNALIDTGATHSFISVNFVMKLEILSDEFFLGFCVLLPSGKELKSNKVNGEPFVFYATAKRRLSGVISAASLMGDQEMQRPKLEELEVMKDFPKVFLDDVAGLPPVRKVEFGIELLPGTKPTSKALYRLAPTEMKELKDQLQELLDKR
ncbi:uncharacterized protein [Henckelia pumila]|uniref:uncharacterized protein n=1 Tax=Henckelia pumila TaxID=405737 RepID=UPI003C6DEBB4